MQTPLIDRQLVDIAYTAFILVTTIMLVYATLAAVRGQKRPEETEPKLITILKCPKCGYQTRRPFRKGDFIGLETGEECPNCGAKLIVDEIYAETPTELPSKTLLQQRKNIKKKNPQHQ
jgi:ssDNA-binding Zn-finger/Zn-ribbon topoisomerase 1